MVRKKSLKIKKESSRRGNSWHSGLKTGFSLASSRPCNQTSVTCANGHKGGYSKWVVFQLRCWISLGSSSWILPSHWDSRKGPDHDNFLIWYSFTCEVISSTEHMWNYRMLEDEWPLEVSSSVSLFYRESSWGPERGMVTELVNVRVEPKSRPSLELTLLPSWNSVVWVFRVPCSYAQHQQTPASELLNCVGTTIRFPSLEPRCSNAHLQKFRLKNIVIES